MSYYIKIGDLELTKFDLTPSITGLERAKIRTSTGYYSGENGGYIDGQFYGPRTVVILGTIKGSCRADLMQKRQIINNSLPINSLLPIRFASEDGNNYIFEANITDFKMDLDETIFSDYQITLTAPDPYIYLDTSINGDGYISRTVNKIIGGGYVMPMIFPYIYEAGTTPTTINNNTKFFIPLIIDLKGKFTNPKITNILTGDYVQINSTTVTEDEILIDSKQKIVTLNGGSIFPNKVGSWLYLTPGNNIFKLDTDSNEDTSSCGLKYKVPLLGL